MAEGERNRPLSGVLMDEDLTLTLGELCRSCDLPAEELLAMVQEGLIEPVAVKGRTWRFAGTAVRRVHVAVHLQRDLDVNLSGAALALDLLDEIRELRARLRVLESRS